MPEFKLTQFYGDGLEALRDTGVGTHVLVVPPDFEAIPRSVARDDRLFTYQGNSFQAVSDILRLMSLDPETTVAIRRPSDLSELTDPDFSDLIDLVHDWGLTHHLLVPSTKRGEGFLDQLAANARRSLYFRTIGGPAVQLIVDRPKYVQPNRRANIHGRTYLGRSYHLDLLTGVRTQEGQGTLVVSEAAISGYFEGQTIDEDRQSEAIGKTWRKLNRHAIRRHDPIDKYPDCHCGLEPVFSVSLKANILTLDGFTPGSFVSAGPQLAGVQIDKVQVSARSAFTQTDVELLQRYVRAIQKSQTE